MLTLFPHVETMLLWSRGPCPDYIFLLEGALSARRPNSLFLTLSLFLRSVCSFGLCVTRTVCYLCGLELPCEHSVLARVPVQHIPEWTRHEATALRRPQRQ